MAWRYPFSAARVLAKRRSSWARSIFFVMRVLVSASTIRFLLSSMLDKAALDIWTLNRNASGLRSSRPKGHCVSDLYQSPMRSTFFVSARQDSAQRYRHQYRTRRQNHHAPLSRTGLHAKSRRLLPRASVPNTLAVPDALSSSNISVHLFSLELFECFARNDEALNFARPFINFCNFRVAEITFQRQFFGIAHPAVNLNRFGRDPHRGLAGVQFRHRSIAREFLAA